MDSATKDRVARNEASFRSLNETFASGRYTSTPDGQAIGFVCECGDASCSETIDVRRNAYEAVRRNPRRFLVVPGHEIPEAEDVVEQHDGYSVVQKRGIATRIVVQSDPRA